MIKPKVTNIKVINKISKRCNVSMVEFNLENEKDTFCMNIYDNRLGGKLEGAVYMYPALKKYFTEPHDKDRVVIDQILELAEMNNDSIFE